MKARYAFCILLAFMILAAACSRLQSVSQPATSQERPATFDVSLYQGQEILGGDDINFADLLDGGKPIVLNFWGGDCPPCRAEMPAFQNVFENHEDELIFLGVDVGTFFGLGTRQDALDLLRELNITYPAGSSNRTPMVNYKVTALPTTIFFGGNGEVFQRVAGALNESRMELIVSAMLGPP